jgi:hypothetical protein
MGAHHIVRGRFVLDRDITATESGGSLEPTTAKALETAVERFVRTLPAPAMHTAAAA